MDQIINDFDKYENEQLSFIDFLNIVGSQGNEKDQQKESHDAFRVFDQNQSGKISRLELKQLLMNISADPQ